MKLRWNKDNGNYEISVAELCRFARKKVSPDAITGFRLADAEAPVKEKGLVLTLEQTIDDERMIRITGTADVGVMPDGTPFCLFTRMVRRAPRLVSPAERPEFLACSYVTAYIYMQSHSCSMVVIRLNIESSQDNMIWEMSFNREELQKAFDALLKRAVPFLTAELIRQIDGRDALRKMQFPYSGVREGQRELIETVMYVIRRGERLLASAPTGIGKTISVLWPSLRSIGTRRTDRVFYFTARTVTGDAALEALRLLSVSVPTLRGIRISAKERLCPLQEKGGESPRPLSCRGCQLLSFADGTAYEARRDAAVLSLLENHVIDSELLLDVAAKMNICPYELALDVSEYCEMIVCDYSYLLDSDVRLHRYFTEKREENYVFLFDEAHNLPDRAREIHSVRASEKRAASLLTTCKDLFADDLELLDSLKGFMDSFSAVRELCLSETLDRDESKTGYYVAREIPEQFLSAVSRAKTVCGSRLHSNYERYFRYLGEMYNLMQRILRVCAEFSDSGAFVFFAQYDEKSTDCRILCLDPSSAIDEAMKKALSTIAFSATLSPMDYYADVCGCHDAKRLELDSPYDPENLCLVTVDSVSTRLTERDRSADDVVNWIAAAVNAKQGNYIVYFPSYRYLELVRGRFAEIYPERRLISQRPEMTLRERDRFLKEFSAVAESGGGVVAFCVLGGIFSEGIDLTGEKLIGAVIVGVGLPGLSSELNLLTEYYERTREAGRAYATVYPAFNRVLQAAGRVIRGEDDRGVVILIDDRYANPELSTLFPSHWQRMRYADTVKELSDLLARFWKGDVLPRVDNSRTIRQYDEF